MELKGYRRTDGRVGIRNHVLILPASICANETARFTATNIEGSLYLPNQGGCSLSKRDYKITMDTLSGIAANPNVFGVIIIGIGCEVIQAQSLAKEIRKKTNKPMEVFIIRKEGGMNKTMEKAIKAAKSMVLLGNSMKREIISISDIILGTECGGSDPTSGLVANPVVGIVSDILVQHGGTSILSETPEMIGAEHILAGRCKSRELSEQLLHMVKSYENDFLRAGENPRNGNPTPGNIEGGITTLEEKSLGCILKGGESMIDEVLEYSQEPRHKGLVVMDTPGQDVASIAGMAAAGAQIIIFTTGHGTPTGFGIVPVVKVTANSETGHLMKEHIDFDCSNVIQGSRTMDEAANGLYLLMVKMINGQTSKAENLGFNDMSISRYCNFA